MLSPLGAVVPSRPLGIARIAVGCAAVLIALENYVTLSTVARAEVVDVPLLGVMPTVAAGLVQAWFVVAMTAAVAMVAGLMSRASCGVVALTSAWALLWDQQTYSNHQTMLVILSVLLACAHSGAALAIDSRLREPVELVPAWPLFLIKTQVTVLYLFAALSKVNGVFLSGRVLADHMWLELPSPVLVVLSIAAVGTELFLAVALWSRRLQRYAFLLGAALHVSIVVFLTLPVVLTAFALVSTGTYRCFAARARSSPADEPAHDAHSASATRPLPAHA